MNMDRLLASVKKHEGYRNKVYLDTLGKRTVGVGHLCVEDFWEDDKEYEEKFLMTILEHDLQTAIKSAKQLIADHGCMDMDEVAEEIIIEMVVMNAVFVVEVYLLVCHHERSIPVLANHSKGRTNFFVFILLRQFLYVFIFIQELQFQSI